MNNNLNEIPNSILNFKNSAITHTDTSFPMLKTTIPNVEENTEMLNQLNNLHLKSIEEKFNNNESSVKNELISAIICIIILIIIGYAYHVTKKDVFLLILILFVIQLALTIIFNRFKYI